MPKAIRVSMLLVAAILFAAPGAMADKVDCSKLDDDDARKRCREARNERNDNDRKELDDVDVDDADCSKFKDDDARRRCVRAKVKN